MEATVWEALSERPQSGRPQPVRLQSARLQSARLQSGRPQSGRLQSVWEATVSITTGFGSRIAVIGTKEEI